MAAICCTGCILFIYVTRQQLCCFAITGSPVGTSTSRRFTRPPRRTTPVGVSTVVPEDRENKFSNSEKRPRHLGPLLIWICWMHSHPRLQMLRPIHTMNVYLPKYLAGQSRSYISVGVWCHYSVARKRLPVVDTNQVRGPSVRRFVVQARKRRRTKADLQDEIVSGGYEWFSETECMSFLYSKLRVIV